MVRGVATIAQGYQVGSVIDATGGTGYQMMDISLNAWNGQNIPRRDSSRKGCGSMQNEARQTDCRTSDRSLLWKIEREEACAPRKTRWLANGPRLSCGALKKR